MPHPFAPGFVSETEIRHLATLLNVNSFPDHHVVLGWGEHRLTAGDLRRLCTTAMIGARLIEGSADFAFAYGFMPPTRQTADAS
ncbi:hypothetical protein [Acidiphilium acidophilum]|jgi:hypothetical protein|uniref:hypothetical protein n=1 Tax=Acidiphilium acidophilum TaxID=76588 RepID=UPI002E8E7A1E|nr:hypothetical protein [Acidiphilium acidophilum]MEE3503972.1 hypothetical protein [Acidiphilium acidophilum]